MPSFHHGDVEIAYLDEGQNPSHPTPIVLVHGFASNKQVNWVYPGWVDDADALRPPRHRARQSRSRPSTKLYEAGRLSHRDHGGGRAWRCSIISASSAPTSWAIRWGRGSAPFSRSSIRSACASWCSAGSASRLVEGVGLPESIADALLAPSLDDVTDPTGRTFRAFAEQTKSDLKALAACIRGSRQTLTRGGGRRDRDAGTDRGRHQGRCCRLAA